MTQKTCNLKGCRHSRYSSANCGRPTAGQGGSVIPPGIICVFVVITACFSSHKIAAGMQPMVVARIVSLDQENVRFFDAINIDKTFDKLEIPILVGSSVLPAITIVDSGVHDEHDGSLPWGMYGEELIRLDKLQVGPFNFSSNATKSDCEKSSRFNDVRLVLWPSGHVLWVVDEGELPGAIRNRKGKVVEYRFGQIKFDKLMKRVESFISKKERPSGYHRKTILYRYPEFCMARDLVIVNKNFIFKCVSHIEEKKTDSYYAESYAKSSLTTSRPKEDVAQYVDISQAIWSALPPKGCYGTLRSEPLYVWKGKRDKWEKPNPSQPGSPAR